MLTRSLISFVNPILLAPGREALGLFQFNDAKDVGLGYSGRAHHRYRDHGEPAAGGDRKLHPFAGRRKSDPPGCPRNHRMAPQPVRIAKAASKP